MKKNLLKTMAYAAVILLALGFSSCGDDDDAKGSVAELVGTWEGITSDGWWIEDGEKTVENGVDISGERYEFREDMTFDYLNKSNGKWSVSETGKWKFSDGSIKLYYYYEQDDILDEDPDVFKVLDISASNLIWEYHWKDAPDEIYAKASYRKIK